MNVEQLAEKFMFSGKLNQAGAGTSVTLHDIYSLNECIRWKFCTCGLVLQASRAFVARWGTVTFSSYFTNLSCFRETLTAPLHVKVAFLTTAKDFKVAVTKLAYRASKSKQDGGL